MDLTVASREAKQCSKGDKNKKDSEGRGQGYCSGSSSCRQARAQALATNTIPERQLPATSVGPPLQER
eukprot:324551-Hanusia_phi.AAC.1